MLTDEEVEAYVKQEWLQAGVYEPQSHVLTLPTRYRASDLERVAIHELGHALTYRRAARWAADRPDLLDGLPLEIESHVFLDDYETAGDGRATTHTRVLEAIADGYLWVIAGRASELSYALNKAVFDALPDPDDGLR